MVHVKKKIFFLFLGAALLLGCSADHDATKAQPLLGLDAETPLAFATVQSSILKSRCNTCHSQYNSYEGVILELDAIIDSVENGRMPKNAAALSKNEIAYLKRWASAGAPIEPDLPPAPIPEPPPLEATWESIRQRVFQPHCVICHNPEGEVPWVDLSTREAVLAQKEDLFNVADPRSSYIVELILDPNEPMPPPNTSVRRLTQDQIGTLIQWISEDLP